MAITTPRNVTHIVVKNFGDEMRERPVCAADEAPEAMQGVVIDGDWRSEESFHRDLPSHRDWASIRFGEGW